MLDVMLSSTVKDMIDDRAAVTTTLQQIPILRTVGAAPIVQPPIAASPHTATVEMAAKCDLYILLLGSRYGDARPGEKSPTELEFDSAFAADPTKILVLKKRVPRRNARQGDFVDRVGSYYHGYWTTSYTTLDQLSGLVLKGFEDWIKSRAAIGSNLNYFDHFLRLAVQKSPLPGVQGTYSVTTDLMEFRHNMFGTIRTLQIEKSEILRDFWGCIALLERTYQQWRSE